MPTIPMVNMKIDASAKQKAYAESPISDGPTYPWGLGLHLDDDALEKLGIERLPAAGETLMIVAKVSVTSVSETAEEGTKGKRRSVSLQITDLGIGPTDEEKPIEAKLYGAGHSGDYHSAGASLESRLAGGQRFSG